jgi:hypothetical protein
MPRAGYAVHRFCVRESGVGDLSAVILREQDYLVSRT